MSSMQAGLAAAVILFGGALSGQQTSVTLTASANPAMLGQLITVTASVNPAAASGKVTFYDGTSILGTKALAGGQAVLTTSLLPSGVRLLRAYFGGGGNYLPSTSATVAVTVNAVPTNGFLAGASYTLGPSYTGPIAIGDFNGDGIADLAVGCCNEDASGVDVLLGSGGGTFRPPVHYVLGEIPTSVLVADFNGDGKADLAVSVGGGAFIFLGNGDGSFQVQPYIGLPPIASMVVGDFNGDGKADLAVLSAVGYGLSILLGRGDGSFQPLVTYQTSLSEFSLVIGDYNGDGKADLAFISTDPFLKGTLNVLLGNGDGTFQAAVAYAIGSSPVLAAVADFNGDGRSDLAVSNSGDNTVSVFLANSDGTFRPAVKYSAGSLSAGSLSSGASALAAGDLNGDGKIDLFVTNSNNVFSVLLGTGAGTFQAATTFASGSMGQSLAVGDLNGDGKTDLAIGGGGMVGVLLGSVFATSTTAVASSPNPSIEGQSVSFKVTVTPATATGSVSFYDGPTLLGTKILVSGQATLNVSVLSVGTHSVTVNYAGDMTFGASSSPALVQTVNHAQFSSTTTLSSLTNPAILGQSATLIAIVTPQAATGRVTFYDGTTVMGSATVMYGQALLTTSLLASGTRSLTAVYSGDTNLVPSASAVFAQTVRDAPANGFQTALRYGPTLAAPYSVAIGDFNGDGKPDMAVANWASQGGVVGVYLGNGNGTFQGPVYYTAGNGPKSVAVGDFNRDGKADLVVANSNGSDISVLLGNGDGTFQGPVSYTVGTSPSSVVVADFNRDGKPDVVVVTSSDLRILVGDGDGTFQPAVPIDIGVHTPTSVAVGDLNGDGKADLIVIASGTGYVLVCLGNGDGTFQTTAINLGGEPAVAVAVADFNGDGKPDLAVSNGGYNTISVLLGRGDGTFQAPVDYGGANDALFLTVGDLNGDGIPDVIAANANSSDLSLFIGRGDGTLSPGARYRTGWFATSLAIGDLNGDGRADLISTSTDGYVNVLVGSLAPAVSVALTSSQNPSVYGQNVTLTATVSPSTAAGNVTFYDGTSVLGIKPVVNGQASLTTSLLDPGMRSIQAVFQGNSYTPGAVAGLAQTVSPVPSSGFQTSYQATYGNAFAVAVADFNRDGKSDLVIADLTGNISVLLGNGDGTFRPAGKYYLAGFEPSVAVGDFNGDGQVDLAATDFEGDTVLIFLGKGDGTFQSPVSYSVSKPINVAVGDFNRDGIADLVIGNWFFAGGVAVLPGNGDGTFQQPLPYPTGNTPTYVAVGDVNGDGKADLVVSDFSGTSVSVLLGNGDGSFQSPMFYAAGGNPSAVAMGDFNGDGNVDLVVSNYGDNTVSLLLGNGDGTFRGPLNFAAGNQPHFVLAADINGDGKLDLVVANHSGATVLLGNGNGTFQAAMSYAVGSQVNDIAIGDFNGDGRVDLALSSVTGVTILLGKVSLTGARMSGSRVGVFRGGSAFLEDSNGNTVFDAGVDRFIPNFTGPGGFVAGDIPVTGDWTGDGNTKVGIYRSSTGTWFLDANNNGIFDAGDYQYQFGGLAGDIPFAGDWNGLGKSCIGLYRSIGSVWLLDLNCNGAFENAPNDAFFPFGGVDGDVPVVGSWTGGTTRVGVVRKYAPGGVPQGNPFYWVLDGGAANAGSAAASHQPGFTFAFGGLTGDVFVTGDWNNNGTSAAGVFRAGFWVLDAALPGAPQASHRPGLTFGYGGVAGDVPVVGKW